jgi:SMC interacting uncharacterized protein involved in chromosome segregation
MIRAVVVLLIAVIGLGSAWQLERSRGRVALQDATISTLQTQTKTLQDQAKKDTITIEQERAWAASRESVIQALLAIGKDVQNMQDEIRQQDKERAATLQELIKNDKAIRDYMRMAVPTNLGLQYERKATTDPTKYGASGSMSTSPVRDAGKTAPKK